MLIIWEVITVKHPLDIHPGSSSDIYNNTTLLVRFIPLESATPTLCDVAHLANLECDNSRVVASNILVQAKIVQL